MPAKRRHAHRGRPRRQAPHTLPDDLYDYDDDPAPRISSPRASSPDAFDVEKLPVIDDWPEKVPITEAEVQVFERWFADVFDEMFGPLPAVPGLTKLSSDDNEKP
ncbi:hypothetical protein E0H22_24590 [Rhodopseudomonas boonkerdii]|uniref:hypothetical protein n=1 Tax=Rhodopseudomonas boonkerdii TaxID=475937 RepID=UPI001E518EA5|nr:hypothetical protein [Rhodopseudomonas boonkerdii]UGV28554.1 hypothetical protein E0H22_24590 [Rhodopseudomonas boonkerdii]